MAHSYELEDDWDDVRYVEHDEGAGWVDQPRLVSSKSDFTKRLKAEAKVSSVLNVGENSYAWVLLG